MAIDLSQLTIVLATPVLKAAHTRACFDFPPWSDGMPYEAFETLVWRELEEGEWAKGGRDLTWILINRNDPDEMLSGCETHRTAAMMKRRGGTEVEDGWMYGVTSVITPEKYRRKGYARHLLQLLHYVLARPCFLPPFPDGWGARPTLADEHRLLVPYAIASYMWSDIGPNAYASCRVGESGPGYTVQPEDQREITWKTRSCPPGKSFVDIAHEHGWTVLYRHDMPRIVAEVAKTARDRLATLDSSKHCLLSLDPASNGTLTFTHKRMDFVENPSWRLPRDVEPMGIEKDGTVVLFTRWSFHIADALLITYILDLRAEDIEGFVQVCEALCAGTGVGEVMVWDLDAEGDVVRELKRLRGATARLREGMGAHLYAKVFYEGSGEGDEGVVVDKQMWTWV